MNKPRPSLYEKVGGWGLGVIKVVKCFVLVHFNRMVLEIPKTSQILRCCREIITLYLEIPKIKYSEHAYNKVLGTGNFSRY